jgi:ribokinase
MRPPYNIVIVGPAYLDDVILIDRPIVNQSRYGGIVSYFERLLADIGRFVETQHIEAFVAQQPFVVDYSVEEMQRTNVGGQCVISNTFGDKLVINRLSTAVDTFFLGEIIIRDRIVQPARLFNYANSLFAHLQITSINTMQLNDWLAAHPFTMQCECCEQNRFLMLGGMGAGYAAALNGFLVLPLGGSADGSVDEWGKAIIQGLNECNISHQAQVITNHTSDITTLITSGSFGDKMPISLRDASYYFSIDESVKSSIDEAEVVVITSFKNEIVRDIINAAQKKFIFFAPAMRNVNDVAVPIHTFAEGIDYLSLNKTEWSVIVNAEQLTSIIPIISVTDGIRGSDIFYHDTNGAQRQIHLSCFNPNKKPLDTNHAGEAYAAAFLQSLLAELSFVELKAGKFDDELIWHAGIEATIAADLELDITTLAFPSREEILYIRHYRE